MDEDAGTVVAQMKVRMCESQARKEGAGLVERRTAKARKHINTKVIVIKRKTGERALIWAGAQEGRKARKGEGAGNGNIVPIGGVKTEEVRIDDGVQVEEEAQTATDTQKDEEEHQIGSRRFVAIEEVGVKAEIEIVGQDIVQSDEEGNQVAAKVLHLEEDTKAGKESAGPCFHHLEKVKSQNIVVKFRFKHYAQS